MPGSRLTYEDRQDIAAGVAEGLGYAEIARRLRRPTSTISREITRNGGYDAYRAEEAHQATKGRAHRLHQPPPVTTREAVRDFMEQFAVMMVQTGLPRMPARVLVCLLTSDSSSLPATELIRRLQVSPASISKAITYLEQVGLVRRERDARERRERYIIDDDVWYRACLQQVQVCATWASASLQGAKILGDTPAGARLHEMSRYFDHVGHDLAQAAEHWRHVFTAQATDH